MAMTHTEMRQFILESNRAKLSPAEKDVFLYYQSRAQNGKEWRCPDDRVADEIGRSRNTVCVARNDLKKRGWIRETSTFIIAVLRQFSVRNVTEASQESDSASPKPDSSVRNVTQPVRNVTAYKDKKKEEKLEGEKKEPKSGVVGSDVESVFEFWQITLGHPTAHLTLAREKTIRARLVAGYSVADLKQAILGCKSSPHHQGQNDQRKIYDDLEMILRNDDQLEKMIGYTRQPQGIQNGTNRQNGKRTDADVIAESATFYANYDEHPIA